MCFVSVLTAVLALAGKVPSEAAIHGEAKRHQPLDENNSGRLAG
jgi:hypothetical protein